MTEQEARIRELESQLAERDEMISTLQNSIKELNRLVTNLTEIITQMRKDKFGAPASSFRCSMRSSLNPAAKPKSLLREILKASSSLRPKVYARSRSLKNFL